MDAAVVVTIGYSVLKVGTCIVVRCTVIKGVWLSGTCVGFVIHCSFHLMHTLEEYQNGGDTPEKITYGMHTHREAHTLHYTCTIVT